MSRFLTREDILSVKDCGVVAVPVPEWANGDEVPNIYIRRLNGAGRQEVKNLIDKPTVTEVEIEQIGFIACVSDADGKPLFTREDLPAIAEKFAGVVARIGRKALLLNKFGKAALDEAEKN